MKTIQKTKIVLKATLVFAVTLAFLLPSATAYTITNTHTSANLIAQNTDVKFQKVTSDKATMGLGADILVSGETSNENTPAIVQMV